MGEQLGDIETMLREIGEARGDDVPLA
jgi:hypothetical protein